MLIFLFFSSSLLYFYLNLSNSWLIHSLATRFFSSSCGRPHLYQLYLIRRPTKWPPLRLRFSPTLSSSSRSSISPLRRQFYHDRVPVQAQPSPRLTARAMPARLTCRSLDRTRHYAALSYALPPWGLSWPPASLTRRL